MQTITEENTTPVALPQKIGDEFLVGRMGIEYSSVTNLTNGAFVVSLCSRYGIVLEVFDTTGTKVGEGWVSDTVIGLQRHSNITGLINGSFVVTWTSGNGQSDVAEVKAQVFDPIGTKVGSEFLVNTTTVGSQSLSTITGLSNGGFVITWVDGSGLGGDSSVSSIKAQVFDATGTKVGSEFLVNTTTENQQNFPTLTGLANDCFVVTWTDRSGLGGDSDPGSIKAQIFDATGAKVGSEFLVNTTTVGSQSLSTITGLSNGGFVITWSDTSYTGGVKAQVFDATGAKLGSELLVKTTPGDSAPTITNLTNGCFVITWDDWSSGRPDVKAQLFDATGARVGSEFLVNTTTAGYQAEPTITGLSNGGFVVAWLDGSDPGIDLIKAQMFGFNDHAPVITTAAIQTVPENTNIVGTLTSTDLDAVGTNPATFSISGGSDAALFHVVTAAEGSQSLQFVTAPDYETNPHSYEVEVSAFDGVNTTANTITVNLTDVNEAATAVALANATVSLAENTVTASHIKVADITVTDDALGTNILALTGVDAAAFEIVGTELFLKAGTVLDFESKASYAVAVTVDDPNVGTTPDATSTIYALDVSNVPGVTITGTSAANTIDATHTVAGQPFPTNEEDTINAGGGNDKINALAGNDFINGGAGADTMFGGTGNDTYVVDNSGDIVNETGGDGLDTVHSSITFSLSNTARAVGAIENLTLTGSSKIDGTGNAFDNVITGNAGNNILTGLAGADTLIGLEGNDKLIGGADADTLTGGLGSNRFVFTALSDSTVAAPDTIMDFVHGADVIDLGSIDANSSRRGDQAFAFGGENTSVVANGVTWFEDGGTTVVQADVNGDAHADLQIILAGVSHNLTATDFFF